MAKERICSGNPVEYGNPIERFMGEDTLNQTAAQTEKTVIPDTVPDGYKLNPLFIEKRTKRLQLVLQPSLYDRIKKRAAAEGISLNEYCHRVLEEAVEE